MLLEGTFSGLFKLLTGHPPFPWQERLFAEFVANRVPPACDIPTGLGKTATLAVWLLAVAHHARAGTLRDFPRRLVYVVNRRTVVDQATHEAKAIRDALTSNPGLALVANTLRSLAIQPQHHPLAISTLRGEFADNGEWRQDPARPAIIIGTVDMIGSRLLFAGYGCGFKSKPLHGGFLGQDVLLVHDEAHLEPAFQTLLDSIQAEQQRCRDFAGFHVLALTATARGGHDGFGLTDVDREHEVVRARICARKGIAFTPEAEEKKLAEAVANRLENYSKSEQCILVFLRKVEDVAMITKRLPAGAYQMLTGTLRGLERDALAKSDPVFARFTPDSSAPRRKGTVYLVCTSAGEVGVNVSADHLVCDLTPFDSMAQRLGRVNRFGEGDAHVDVFYSPSRISVGEKDDASVKPYDRACARTLRALQQLDIRNDGRHDASPAALASLPPTVRLNAFTPPPTIRPATDILFDAWALTSIRDRLPGRPPVADWLHGLAEWEPPETHVAWRDEVEILTTDIVGDTDLAQLLEDYPLKPHELLTDRHDRVRGHIEQLANRNPELNAWVIDVNGGIRRVPLRDIADKDKRLDLADCTILLPPRAGGLNQGMLDGKAEYNNIESYDVADRWLDQADTPRRCRRWDDDEPPGGMRLVRVVDTRPGDMEGDAAGEEFCGRRFWRWYTRPRSADDDGSRTAPEPQHLEQHLRAAERFAGAMATSLGLQTVEASAVRLAARWHDRGKRRALWQRAIGNCHYPDIVLAKSGHILPLRDVSPYRHEFGSLLDLMATPEFLSLDPDVRDLVLHLVAAHHGRARPHFTVDEVFDPEHSDDQAAVLAREVPLRFADLQRKYGRWGLAYLESLVRAADALASQARDSGDAVASVAMPQPEMAR